MKEPTVADPWLKQLIERIVHTEGCTEQSALRDIMTDLCHIATAKNLDIEVAFDGALAVYKEEIELEKQLAQENTSKAVLLQPINAEKRRKETIRFAISYLMANLNDAIETSCVDLKPTLEELDLIYQEFNQ